MRTGISELNLPQIFEKFQNKTGDEAFPLNNFAEELLQHPLHVCSALAQLQMAEEFLCSLPVQLTDRPELFTVDQPPNFFARIKILRTESALTH